ncbi:hypothetical protein [Laspinema olomoucense]|uniref:hypothetical protein n=1 Tax=Laspinema olomoucense TaxID=3231600 RepID=UPI0021BB1408|nr:hypothetical protein [Laspinema sp. D3c]MCT7993427.1 hypothetical protein [Laspinema sp. D3c]
MKICPVQPAILAIALLGPLGWATGAIAQTLSPLDLDTPPQDCQACLLDRPTTPTRGLPLAPNHTESSWRDPEMISQTSDNPTGQNIRAQTQQLQQRLQTLQQVPLQQIYLGAPGTSSNTPTAYGGRFGSVGVGFSYQQRTRYTDEGDGTTGLVMSFGDPQNVVGLDVGVTLLDLSSINDRGSFGERGSFNFKAHRAFPGDLAVAVGLENALIWGFSDADTSLYGVVSKRFRLSENSQDPFSRLSVSAGVGNGRFRTEDQVQDDEGSIGVFGSVAVQVIPPVSVFTEWTGQDLNIGASVLPFRNLPLVITPTLSDITGTAGDGTRFTLGVGYGMSFF